MIGGTDYQVIETHEIAGHRVQLIEWSPNRREWRCTCAEYRNIKPLTMKAWCGHCERAVTGAPPPRDTV